jgi:YggT family protein
MIIPGLIDFVQMLTNFFIMLVVVSSLLSFFLPPYHPVREALGRILNPFLDPIRRLMPSGGGLDFSPVLLIFAVQILSYFLVTILNSMR